MEVAYIRRELPDPPLTCSEEGGLTRECRNPPLQGLTIQPSKDLGRSEVEVEGWAIAREEGGGKRLVLLRGLLWVGGGREGVLWRRLLIG